MSFVIGIDGGGTQTTALLADSTGAILGRGSTGPSNIQSAGAEPALASLDQALAMAYREAGISPQPARAMCLGLGGAGRPADRELIEAWAAHRWPGVPLRVVTDAELVLAAGTPQGWGLALVAGTGSIAISRDRQGRTARSGGWGYLFGDEGSGYFLGVEALRAVARAADGRGPQTALTASVLQHFGLANPAGLVAQVYNPDGQRARIAGLAPLVETAAGQGDDVAIEIVQRAGQHLAELASAAARLLDLPSPAPCGLGGSLLVKGTR